MAELVADGVGGGGGGGEGQVSLSRQISNGRKLVLDGIWHAIYSRDDSMLPGANCRLVEVKLCPHSTYRVL